MTRSLAPPVVSAGSSKPSPRSVSTFAGVAIAALAQSTPSTANSARVPESWTIEST